jgi:hypothetical protein
MNNIDLSRIITADDKAARSAAAILTARKSDCRDRIFAVADSIAQINLAAAASAGLLDTAQMAIYRAGLEWINNMRTASATGNWPDVPSGVAALAAQY